MRYFWCCLCGRYAPYQILGFPSRLKYQGFNYGHYLCLMTIRLLMMQTPFLAMYMKAKTMSL